MLDRAGHLERRLGPYRRGVANRDSVDRERGDEPQRVIDRGRLHRPVERGAEVVDLARDGTRPSELVGAPQSGTGCLGDRHEMIGVTATNRGRVNTGFESLLRVLADHLQQAIAQMTRVVGLRENQRLVDQLSHHVDHIESVEVFVAEDRLGRTEVAVTGEHRQTVQRGALAFVEKFVRPVDGVAQRLVTLQRAATAAGEQLEPLIEPIHEVFG